MCEILIQVHDKVNNDDPYDDALCPKAGDVIVVCPDGWNWGTVELCHPDWRIISLPNMTEDEASIFLGTEKDTNPAQPSRVLQFRATSLNIDDLSVDLSDDTRAQPILSSDMTYDDISQLQVVKPALQDPAIIGPVSNTL